jgi:peptidase M23-like protein/cell shape-determining metallopeptidase Csd3-like protein
MRLSAGGAVVLLLLPTQLPIAMEQVASPASAAPLVPPAPLVVLNGTIGRNTNLASVLGSTLSPTAIHRMVEKARPLHDLARISVGHPFSLVVGNDGFLSNFSYAIDELRTLRVIGKGGDLEAEVLTRTYDERTEVVQGVITSSLFGAVNDAGEQDQLALDLAEIFAWDVDFHTELQKGDSFRVAVEKMYLDGRLCRYGRILSAEFVRGDRTLRAVRFEGARSHGYYTPEGRPLRKAFLRSPLKFSRISSGFTHSRFHPILKKVRPHLGVDYAAPVGTPVMASGDGVVILAGWSGGYGKTVRLRHPNGYETLYGHLSRINVKAGQRVTQEMFIGAVGMTGLATGPHLDYRMIKNGVFLNPLKIQSPPAEPVPRAERAAFEATRDRALALLERAGSVDVRTASASR